MIITADHGNDPKIGHSHHTREMVPILIYKDGCHNGYIGERDTLADIGQTAADFFNKKLPDNGKSFLELIVQVYYILINLYKKTIDFYLKKVRL